MRNEPLLILADSAARQQVARVGWAAGARLVELVPDGPPPGRGVLYDHRRILCLTTSTARLLELNRGLCWRGQAWWIAQPLGQNARLLALRGDGPCLACLPESDPWLGLMQAGCAGWPQELPPPAATPESWQRLIAALPVWMGGAKPGEERLWVARHRRWQSRRRSADPECPMHGILPRPRMVDSRHGRLKVGELVAAVRAEMGPQAVVDPGHQLVRDLWCPGCRVRRPAWWPLSRLPQACPSCGEQQIPRLLLALGLEDDVYGRSMAELGIVEDEVVVGRRGRQLIPWRIRAEA